MNGELYVQIGASDILIDQESQKPKTFFQVEIFCENQKLYTLHKQYKDFAELQKQLQATFVQSDEELYNQIPQMPPKRSPDLPERLVAFMNSIVGNQGLCHLLIVRSFLSEGLLNSNHSINGSPAVKPQPVLVSPQNKTDGGFSRGTLLNANILINSSIEQDSVLSTSEGRPREESVVFGEDDEEDPFSRHR